MISREEQLHIAKSDAYQEGFLHAICQVKLNSVAPINYILWEALCEEGFECFEDAQNLIWDWDNEQKETLKSCFVRGQ